VGVYALYDDKRNLQYVGYSRNVPLAVKVRLAGAAGWRAAWLHPSGRAAAVVATEGVHVWADVRGAAA
jgi:hypothetical protein